jgi:hypothetical protein
MNDIELLREYAERQSEAAFAALAQRRCRRILWAR